MKKHILFIVLTSIFITACSTPVHLHKGSKNSTKGLSYIHANTDEIKIESIDGVNTPNSSSIGDQDYYIQPGTHTLIGKLNWGSGVGIGYHITRSKNTKSYCFKTKPDVKYYVRTKFKRNGDWVIVVEELDSGKVVGCN